jgi:hypothetical protein
MSNDWEDPQNDGGGVANLRKNYKKAMERLADLESKLAGTVERERKFSVNEELAKQGLDPRVAKFYPADLGADSESVTKWVEENHELFGYRSIADEQNTIKTTSLTDAEVRGYQMQQDIAAYENAVQMDLATRLKQAESEEEVMHVLHTYAPPTM